jgi:N-acetylmuramoyl-L-alanine amidase
LLVEHYTAGGSGKGAADGLYNGGVSCHFVVDRNGDVYQCSALRQVCWHTGQSAWKPAGITKGCNSYSIGIEHANWGWWSPDRQKPDKQGRYHIPKDSRDTIFTWHGDHKRPFYDKGFRCTYWEPYPEAQIEASLKLSAWILEQCPTIKWIVGHDDIAPGRKQDPGPAFPMERYQALLKAR